MEWRYCDTHAHVNLNAFEDDRDEVVGRAREAGVAHINVGTQIDTSKKAVEIAEQYDDLPAQAGGVYAIVGLHPIHTSASHHDEQELGEESKGFTSRGEEFDADAYRELAKSEKVVGIGECGFDYYRVEKNTREIQEEAFIAQIELANELGLPLMVHTRDAKGNSESAKAKDRSAYDDVYDVLKQYAKVPGNMHFYAGTWKQAKKFFDIGFTISFTGVITFTSDYDEIVKNAPLDMMHAETDCPYVAPKPYRGERNEPLHVREVYERIAETRGEGEEKIRLQFIKNAERLYKITLT